MSVYVLYTRVNGVAQPVSRRAYLDKNQAYAMARSINQGVYGRVWVERFEIYV